MTSHNRTKSKWFPFNVLSPDTAVKPKQMLEKILIVGSLTHNKDELE